MLSLSYTGTSSHSPSKFASRRSDTASSSAAGSSSPGFSTGTVAMRRRFHQLHGLVVHPVAVPLLVRGVEALLELLERVGLHRQLEGLAPCSAGRPCG